LALRLSEDRGACSPEKDIWKDAWSIVSWLFRDGDTSLPVELTSEDERGTTRSLSLRLLDGPAARQEYGEQLVSFRPTLLPEAADWNSPYLILTFREGEGKEVMSQAVWSLAGALAYSQATLAWKPQCAFLGSGGVLSALILEGPSPSPSALEAFSRLELQNRQDELLGPLRHLEPRLRRLALLQLGGRTALHADFGTGKLMPFDLSGEGVRRLLAILLAILDSAGGFVLIDEVENGLHHTALTKVWQAIGEAARKADVQVFATTHSYECVMAAQQAFAGPHEDELRFHRLERRGDEVKAVTATHEALTTAYDFNWEVR
jgi:hypothetical protein